MLKRIITALATVGLAVTVSATASASSRHGRPTRRTVGAVRTDVKRVTSAAPAERPATNGNPSQGTNVPLTKPNS
jgi:hypothetical protein